MRKDFGKKNYVYPQLVLILGTYDEDGTPNAMNAAWGGVYDTNEVFVSLSSHKTTENFERTGCFTLSFGVAAQTVACDYVGIVSGKNVHDKVAKAGWHATKGKHVDAPIFEELPLALECRVKSWEGGNLIGEVVNVSADESILDSDGNIDSDKIAAIIYDPIKHKYRVVKEAVGDAFKDGNKLK